MRLVLQRVSGASVAINGGEPRKISKGLAILAGFTAGDDGRTAIYMAEKAANLRVTSVREIYYTITQLYS